MDDAVRPELDTSAVRPCGTPDRGPAEPSFVRLRWSDVDMKRRTVTLPVKKNGDSRTVPMTETLYGALRALPRPIDPDAGVLPPRDPMVLTPSFARLVKRLGLRRPTFHDLRDDAGSTLTMAGVPQRTIMAILGHRDPRTTVRSQHLAPRHLQAAVRALDTAALAGGDGTTAPAQNENAGRLCNPAFPNGGRYWT